MSKKIIATILCLAMVLSLCGCGAQTTYTFEGVSGGPTTASSVSNNGTNMVFVDGYAFYVNNSRSAYAKNVFGETTEGAIVRQDLASGEIVTIQPKLVADQNAVGLFVSGSKLFYTSPSDTTDRDGKIQSSYLDIMVCDLNGANPQKLYTFGKAVAVTFLEENGVVFAVFEDQDGLKVIDLSVSSPASKVICEEYAGGKISPEGVFIVKSEGYFQDVYKIAMDGTQSLIISGKTSENEKHDITILSVADGKIAYTMKDDVVKQNAETFVCNLDGSNAEKITSLAVSSAVIPYAGGYIFQVGGDIFLKQGEKFTLLDDSKAGAFQAEGDYLFTCTFKEGTAELNKTNIAEILAGKEVESVVMFEDAEDLVYQSTFDSIIFNNGVGYYYSNNSETKEMHSFDVAGVTSKSIAK